MEKRMYAIRKIIFPMVIIMLIITMRERFSFLNWAASILFNIGIFIFSIDHFIETKNLKAGMKIHNDKKIKQLLYGVLLALLMLCCMVGMVGIIGMPLSSLIIPITDIREVYFQVFYLISVALNEEFFYRGYLLYHIYKVSDSKIVTIIVTSLVFGMVHYVLDGSIIQLIFTTVVGLLLSYFKLYFTNCTIVSLCVAHYLYLLILTFIRYFLGTANYTLPF
ncbi:CPBP family intramembrane metalloprotease [Lachnospiraceae bacterium OttesenSCG-928-D06]|nr:CPBP family intramembrane metalloprotease [Lachnospiraceae bacterium OttesenSCG-928-D06]